MSEMCGKIGWLYTARRVTTQANAGGGAIVVDISVPAGVTAKLVSLFASNSGTNSAYARHIDEDNALGARLASIGSAASTEFCLPSQGAAASTSGNLIDSKDYMVSPGQSLSIYQAGAGAQNDTLTIAITLLMSSRAEPTWSKARSTNQADVTIAASTISAANTLQGALV